MRQLLRFGIVALLYSGHLCAQTRDSDIIKQLNANWMRSYAKRDTATLARILDDDIVLISPRGAKMTKKDILANIMLPNQEIVSVVVDSVTVRMIDRVGVLTAYTTFVSKANGKEMTGKNCFSDVYVHRNGKWTVTAAHVTMLSLN